MHKLIATGTGIAMALTAIPAFANSGSHFSRQSSDITVSNSNYASVSNTVTTGADTGGNTANGGGAHNTVAGNGSNGMNSATGGMGGGILTGNALSTSLVDNTVNSTDTKISASCGCKGDITVTNRNKAHVTNVVMTDAYTGYNTANGGDASNDVTGGSSRSRHHHGQSGSNGDNLAEGGVGGVIVTGNADALSSVTSVVNTTVTRIRR